jgi:hypothetical protein
MATITPNTGNPNASLSSPLITPGGPMVSVAKANPYEHAQGKDDGSTAETKRGNAVTASGHANDRSL